ncbi:DUF4382 domain-containing protein [Aquirhabdus parva]|uniref:DUF4382 domain-containing protein n=1 Tax=Aquirhabdus parva TaxID=2283318 RepID=A0A345P902_9GAMM|nr:DUF4382 domain-containing protein [Aquirhabdus parva]AXI03761.1 DUF4382 domain-containing protein [Aquirhabdus parva]
MKILFPVTLVTAALALTACGGGGGGNDAPASNSGTVNVAITDNPSCGFNHVWVTVQQIRVNGSATAGDNDAGWQTLTLATPQRIDLLSLTNGVLQQLGQFPLSAGQYQQIRLVLVANGNTVVPTTATGADGTEVALSTPSATQSGYKVIGNFTVQPNTLTDLVLDFDACRSIVQKGNGAYSLKPVVTATPVVVSGRIKGYVSPTEVGAMVYAEQNGHVIKGTVVNTDGSFTLAPLVQSSANGNYDVVVVDKGYADAIIRAVPVTANADTTVSTAAAPISTPASGVQIASGSATSASDGILVRALQTVNGGTYEIASMVTNGSFSFTLPAGTPTYVGTYSSTLPIALTSNGIAAGQYQIEADETVTGAVQTTPINITSSSITNLNFKF